MGYMRKFFLICFGAVIAVIAVESVCSYVLYRHFARTDSVFHPAGSSTFALIEHVILAAQGMHMMVRLSSDRFPLFSPDEKLGYVMNPGAYNIVEDYDHQKHMFHLQVTESGGRATSYIPVHATHRLFFTGDSSIFGWGLNDEETIPWLLQSRLPNDQVVNLSLTSYSTVQALMQLSGLNPKLSAEDGVILLYHPITNDFNIAVPSMLQGLMVGYEMQLGDPKAMMRMKVPFGSLDPNGRLEIQRIELSCATSKASPTCARSSVDLDESMRVTERAFDDILALHPGHVIVAVVSGTGDDPVIRHLRAERVAIADVRLADDEPDAHEVMPTDKHAGPFWQYRVFGRLLAALRSEGMLH
ncbi:MAG: hypothetical protein ACLPTF_15085 [Steroidobacteraceae bacterium]